MVLLLISAEGLRRGRRAAWWAALLLNADPGRIGRGLAIEWLECDRWNNSPPSLDSSGGTSSVAAVLLPLTLPALVAGLLLLTLLLVRRSRTARHLPPAYRDRAGHHRGGLGRVRGRRRPSCEPDFDRPPTVGDLLLALPARFVPPAYLTEIDPPFLPTRPAATVLYEWPGVLVLLVLAVGLALSFRRNRADTFTGDQAHARNLLTASGGSSFSYMTLWWGNSYWFTSDGRGYVAYRVVGAVAVTTADPVGAPEDLHDTITGFAGFCADRGLTACLYAVTTATRDVAEHDLQWRSVQVAEETIVPLARPELHREEMAGHPQLGQPCRQERHHRAMDQPTGTHPW